jgi:hypothetical protein
MDYAITEEFNLHSLIDKSLPLIGVLVGGMLALISPFISDRIEKRKRKRTIIYELIENLSSYFIFLSKYVIESNLFLSYGRYYELTLYASKGLNKTPQEIHDSLSDLEIYLKHRDYHKSMVDEYFSRGNEADSKVKALIFEFQDYYSTKKFNNIKANIVSLFKDYRTKDKIFLYDFNNLTREQLDVASSKLPQELYLKELEIQGKLDNLIEKIHKELAMD